MELVGNESGSSGSEMKCKLCGYLGILNISDPTEVVEDSGTTEDCPIPSLPKTQKFMEENKAQFIKAFNTFQEALKKLQPESEIEFLMCNDYTVKSLFEAMTS